MKKLLLGLVALATFLKTPMTTVEIPLIETRVETEVTETENYMVDFREIDSYQDTETGLQLNLKDGTSIHVPNVENVTEYVYPICDVVDHNGEYFVIAMPNGSLHGYTLQDPPEGNLERAFFRTINQDNYKDYEFLTVE